MKARRKRRSSNGPARAVALIRKMVGDSRRVDLVQFIGRFWIMAESDYHETGNTDVKGDGIREVREGRRVVPRTPLKIGT